MNSTHQGQDNLFALLGQDAAGRYSEPLNDEEVMAYVLGELSREEEERVRDLLPFDERALQLVLRLGSLPEPPPPGSPADLSEEDLARHRRRLAERIRNEAAESVPLIALAQEEKAPTPLPFATRAEGRLARARRARWSTVMAVAASVGLVAVGWWGLQQKALLLERAIVVVPPGGFPRLALSPSLIPRGGATKPKPATLFARGDRIELRVLLPQDRETAPQGYDLRICTPGKPMRPLRRFSGLTPHEGQELVLWLDRDALPTGDYEIRVVPTGESKGDVVYRVQVLPPGSDL
jgi:hypothetical protein